MIEWILRFFGLMPIVTWVLKSMSVNSDVKQGASARKMTAFAFVMAFMFLIYEYGTKKTWPHFSTICIIIVAGASFFQGLVTVPELLKGMSIFKGGKQETITESSKIETETKITDIK